MGVFCALQVVYELKKKEIEKARSQLEEGREKGEFKASDSAGVVVACCASPSVAHDCVCLVGFFFTSTLTYIHAYAQKFIQTKFLY